MPRQIGLNDHEKERICCDKKALKVVLIDPMKDHEVYH